MLVCRCCLTFEDNLYPFGEYRAAFRDCTGLRAESTAMICPGCIRKLNEAQNFREQSLKSDEILRTQKESGEVVVKSEPLDEDEYAEDFEPMVKIEERAQDQDDFQYPQEAFVKVILNDDDEEDEVVEEEPESLNEKKLSTNKKKKQSHSEKRIDEYTGGLKFKCEVCSKKFAAKIEDETPKHVCNVCGEEFRYTFNLTVHKLSHIDRKKFGCNSCGINFREKFLLEQHTRCAEKCAGIKKSRGETLKTENGSTIETGKAPKTEATTESIFNTFSKIENMDF